NDDATLLVDQFVTPLAHPLVDAIDAQLELRLAPLRDGRRAATAARRADPVLGSLAVRIELGEHLAVIELDCAEIAVGDRDEPLPGAPLLRRQHFAEGGVVNEFGGIAERRRQPTLAIDDSLDFTDLAVADAQPHRVIGRLTVLLHGAEPG